MTSSAIDILFVDDSQDDRRLALRALDREGFGESVRAASSGAEALELLGIEPEDPSRTRPLVVFLDLRMPRIDGWEVLRRIRSHARTARLPVVVVSSSDRPEDVDRSYDMGANSYLVKHVGKGSPGGNIAQAARYWIEINQPSRRAARPTEKATG